MEGTDAGLHLSTVAVKMVRRQVGPRMLPA